jgi:hypothetical protein
MAQKHRYRNNRQGNRGFAPPPAAIAKAAVVYEKKLPTQYGKPFILLEDANKNTFEFKGGQWVAHPLTIADCRENSQVKELPQKVNGMTRYEIRTAVSVDA